MSVCTKGKTTSGSRHIAYVEMQWFINQFLGIHVISGMS